MHSRLPLNTKLTSKTYSLEMFDGTCVSLILFLSTNHPSSGYAMASAGVVAVPAAATQTRQ